MPDGIDKDKLTARLKTLREQEHAKRARQLELAEAVAERDLNPDELAEQDALPGEIEALTTQQTAVERSLKIGSFSDAVNDDVGLTANERRDYSILKLLRAKRRTATPADIDAATLELEASAEIERKTGVAPRGVFLPMEVMGEPSLRYRSVAKELRAPASVDDYSSLGAFVGVDFRPNELIPLLRNMMVLTQVGARYLDGLVGDVYIPRQSGTGQVAWLGREGEDVPETSQAIEQIAMTPRTLGCFSEWTRQLEMQSSIGVENFIREDLMRIMALELDRVAFHGSGASGQPLGITNATGINSIQFASRSPSVTPARNDIVNMRKEIALDNALVDGINFVTEPGLYSDLMKVPVDAGSGRFLLDENGTMLGRGVVESNQIVDGNLILGNWADLIVGRWGTFDLLIDPYAKALSGTTRVIVFQSTDVLVRRPQSFCLAT